MTRPAPRGCQRRGMTLSRRGFTAAAGAVAVAPLILPRSVFGKHAPGNRINVAIIGCGNQSRADVPAMLRMADVQVVAVCDVNRGSHGYARPEHFLGREPVREQVDEHYAADRKSGAYRGCDAVADFRDVLERDDVDAVVVTLPDHWHALVTVMACAAGKDVYCQKPLSLTVDEGRRMVAAVRTHGRILQTGSQYRSHPAVRTMCELVRNGRLGEVRKAIAIIDGSGSGPGPGWGEMPIPDGFDYDLWLGPAPVAPYHVDRCLYRFRFHLDYSGGQVTNTGAHAIDIVQWGLGTDSTGPVEFRDLGSVWPDAGHLYTTAVRTHFGARYANGVELECVTQSPGFGARFEGTEGWIQFTGGTLQASADAILETPLGPDALRLPVSPGHYRDFIDSVKSRQDPIEPVEVGHRTASVCHLGNIAMRLGRPLAWDPAAERFRDDDEADAMLRRPYRGDWTLS